VLSGLTVIHDLFRGGFFLQVDPAGVSSTTEKEAEFLCKDNDLAVS